MPTPEEQKKLDAAKAAAEARHAAEAVKPPVAPRQPPPEAEKAALQEKVRVLEAELRDRKASVKDTRRPNLANRPALLPDPNADYNEIKTNDENEQGRISYWHNTTTMELYRQDGSPTGLFFHIPRKQLPSGPQIDVALGFPIESTANRIKDEFCWQVIGLPGTANISPPGTLDGVSAVLEDSSGDSTIVAPVTDETGSPAIPYNVVLTRKGKRSTHAISQLVWSRLGNNTVEQAYRLEVESARKALQDE